MVALVDVLKEQLPSTAMQELDQIAQERGNMPLDQVLQQMIESESFLRQQEKAGNKILLQQPDGSRHQITFKKS